MYQICAEEVFPFGEILYSLSKIFNSLIIFINKLKIPPPPPNQDFLYFNSNIYNKTKLYDTTIQKEAFQPGNMWLAH